MSENRKLYIEKILAEIKLLEDSTLLVKNNDSLPFSFFRESFDRVQAISYLLHKLEFMQVDEMKNQMEKLVFFLSESEKKAKDKERELQQALEKHRVLVDKLEIERRREKIEFIPQEREVEKIIEKEPEIEIPIPYINIDKQPNNQNVNSESFALPEYRNPYSEKYFGRESSSKIDNEPSVSKSVSNPVHIIDIKRGVSLNDRFLFQRELFSNNRNEMNNTLEKLSSFRSYEDAEKYIRNTFSWDFDSQVVNDFLSVVKKGFK